MRPSPWAGCNAFWPGSSAEASSDAQREVSNLKHRVEQLTEALKQAGIVVPEETPRKACNGFWTRLAAALGITSLILKLRQAFSAQTAGAALRTGLRRVPRRRLRAAGQRVIRLTDSQRLLDMGADIADLHVCGKASAGYPLPESMTTKLLHPVLQALQQRKRSGYVPGSCSDGRKIALAIEGGGMRGCVSAGMAAALSHPAVNLLDAFDCVYGSSAGAVTAAYVVAGQAEEGLGIFYDRLSYETGLGKEFIDPSRIIRPLVGLDASKPGVDLDCLLDVVGVGPHALDFEQLLSKDLLQPLRIIASAPEQGQAQVLSRTAGSWHSLPELLQCLRASALVPGICGIEPVHINTGGLEDDAAPRAWKSLIATWWTGKNNSAPQVKQVPMVDALFFEPLPYRSALRDGCTHILVLRSVKDGTRVSPTQGFFDVNFEDMVYRSFARSNGLDKLLTHVDDSGHKRIYVEDILRLNEEATRFDSDEMRGSRFLSASRHLQLRQLLPPRIMTIALQPEDPAIASLELRRGRLLESTKHGYARAYATLAEDASERNFQCGLEQARRVLPEE